jgi:hypothetical protein
MNRTLKNFDAQLLEEPEDTSVKTSTETVGPQPGDEELEGERMTERIWRKVLDALGKNH